MTSLLPDDLRIYVASEPVDLRASFDRLAQIAKLALKKDPLKGGLFVFRNREGHRAKALLWDRTGWLLVYKRLENGIFHFPMADDGLVEIDAEQLRMLLDGIELGVAPRRKAVL